MTKKSGVYTPSEEEAEADLASNVPNVSGHSPRFILKQEAGAQQAVAESEIWLIARRLNPRGDSRRDLEKLGFKIKGVYDDLFYEVDPPQGWSKSTEGYWTKVRDETGSERFNQFFKAAFYDRDAFVNIYEK